MRVCVCVCMCVCGVCACVCVCVCVWYVPGMDKKVLRNEELTGLRMCEGWMRWN